MVHETCRSWLHRLASYGFLVLSCTDYEKITKSW